MRPSKTVASVRHRIRSSGYRWFPRCAQHIARRITALTIIIWPVCLPAAAQENSRLFAGGLFGVSALSPDAQSVASQSDAVLSLYNPGPGPALNFFAGVHVAQYFSVQANWMWNRNDIAGSSHR
jgi:hypothetical protein